MRKLRYQLVDVFTDRAFGGNPLAVFPDAGDLTAAQMQAIARELNLSETAFVLPPEDSRNDYRVRLFTPAVELPMAGIRPLAQHSVSPQRAGADAEGLGCAACFRLHARN